MGEDRRYDYEKYSEVRTPLAEPYLNRATKYALDVANGKTVAGRLVVLAARRHLDDIDRARDAESGFPYYFDCREADRIIRFAETLTLAEGDRPRPLRLYPFQAFILGSLNGWRKKSNRARRYRTSYVQLGRQNGKSLLNGILAAYYGNFDGYRYPQIYCTATQRDQALIVYKEITKFVRSDADLDECFRIHEHNSTIDCRLTHGIIRALSGDTKRIDGFRPYLGIVDEYHAHKTDQMYKLLEGGMKQMPSALISVITTAGFDLNSPCRELYEICRNILAGLFENDTQFVYIAELDTEDDIWDPRNWVKANPALEYNPDAVENLKPIAATAKEMGGNTLRDFLVKQLNSWLQLTDNIYIKDADGFKKLGERRRGLDAFRGNRAYAGLDLSSGGDLTSIALVIPFGEDGVKKYYVWSQSFMPARRMDEHIMTDRAPYDLWRRDGLITVTETMGGIKTDYKYILACLFDIVKEFDIRIECIAYDPHNASAFLQDLEDAGYNSVSVVQSARSLNDATCDFELEAKAGNVEYDGGNALLVWSFLNAVTVSNSFGEKKLDKDLRTKRIDPCDAVIDAWTMAMRGEETIDINAAVEEWLKVYGE